MTKTKDLPLLEEKRLEQLNAMIEQCVRLLNTPHEAFSAIEQFRCKHQSEIDVDVRVRANFLEARRMIAWDCGDASLVLRDSSELLSMAPDVRISPYKICMAAVEYIKMSAYTGADTDLVIQNLDRWKVFSRAEDCTWGVDILSAVVECMPSALAHESVRRLTLSQCELAGLPELELSTESIATIKAKLREIENKTRDN